MELRSRLRGPRCEGRPSASSPIGTLIPWESDLGSIGGIRKLVLTAKHHHRGVLWALVHVATTLKPQLEDVSEQDWDLRLDVNLAVARSRSHRTSADD